MTRPPLFRAQVLEARRDAWLGEAQIVQPIAIRAIVALTLALVVALAAFVVLGHYTRRVHAIGILAPSTGLITIASPAAGRIVTAGAFEGDRVEKGRLLFVIDVDAISANGATQKLVREQLVAQIASIERQRTTRRAIAAVDKTALEEQVGNTKRQAGENGSQVALQRDLTRSLESRADQLKAASAQGLARVSDFQSQNFLYIEANAQLAQLELSGIQLEGKLSDLQAKLAAFDDTLARDTAELDRSIAQLRQQVVESDAKHAIEIRAPDDGILTSLTAHVGQQVAGGTAMVTLLPSSGRLQADLFVDSSAIGFVDRGEPVMLRYAAFPFQRFGLHRGAVAEVTRAPVDGASGSVPRQLAGASVNGASLNGSGERGDLYRIIVKPDRNWIMAMGERRDLEAGMRVDADIAIEKRPLFRWLLGPLDHLERSAGLVTEGIHP